MRAKESKSKRVILGLKMKQKAKLFMQGVTTMYSAI